MSKNSIKDMIKGSAVTISVAALVAGGTAAWAVCTPDDTGKEQGVVVQEVTKEDKGSDCSVQNLNAKAKYWSDVLSNQNTVQKLSVEEREALVAQDMENAAQNMRSGSYRVCWGE